MIFIGLWYIKHLSNISQTSLKHLSNISQTSLLGVMLLNTSVCADQGDAKKEESAFTSGVGLLIGMGVGTASTQTSVGSFDGNFQNTAAGVSRGSLVIWSNPRVNFLTPASNIKSHTGVAFMTGILAQYVSNQGFTGGLRWVYGRSSSASTVQYPQGNVTNTTAPFTPGAPWTLSVNTTNNSQNFRLKDSYFNAVLFELGCVLKFNFLPKCLHKFQVYVAPGFSMHHQKFSALDRDGNISGEVLSKSTQAPVFALGTRYAISKRISFGFEWQRHMGNKKAWSQVAEIMPKNTTYGVPLMKMNNNLFMFSVTYMFGK